MNTLQQLARIAAKQQAEFDQEQSRLVDELVSSPESRANYTHFAHAVASCRSSRLPNLSRSDTFLVYQLAGIKATEILHQVHQRLADAERGGE